MLYFGTTNMRLHPVETSWAMQLDRQCQKKQEREKTRKAQGQRSLRKRKWLYSDHKQDTHAKKEVIFISLEVLLQQSIVWK